MIDIRGVDKRYPKTRRRGEETIALDNVSMHVEAGHFYTLLGPTGCGKSTLLRLIAGMEPATRGEITVGGDPVIGPDPRRIVVWQDFALMDWRTVRSNVCFGLEVQGVARAERRERAREMLALVGLEKFASHYPNQVSGGMRQRVAIARALAVNPDILLMDEPFGALDAQTRQLMQEELLSIWERWHKTVVFVTHSLDEALLLSDEVALFTARPGRIKEVVEIPFARPRLPTVRADPQYEQLYARLNESLRVEVRRAADEETRPVTVAG